MLAGYVSKKSGMNLHTFFARFVSQPKDPESKQAFTDLHQQMLAAVFEAQHRE